MKKTALSLILLAMLAVLLWCFWPASTTVEPKPITPAIEPKPAAPEKHRQATVAVVHTLDELRNQPPVKLPDGVTIRLGISDLEPYISGGILLYCLATGVEPPMEETKNRWRLGPVAYEVTYPNVKFLKENFFASGVQWKEKGEVLFCTTVHTPDPGDCRIDFVSLAGELLRTATITARQRDPHPWQPAGLLLEDKQWTLFNDPNPGAALPSANGLVGTSNPKKLPHLPLGDTAAQTGDFKIALEGTKLCLTFDRPVVYTPDFPLLCRWWVNDKPVIPPVLTEYPGRSITGKVIESKKVVVNLRADGKKLGAKPGDTIGLQLLYTATGWDYTGHHALILGHGWGKHDPLLSNRIEFKYEKK